MRGEFIAYAMFGVGMGIFYFYQNIYKKNKRYKNQQDRYQHLGQGFQSYRKIKFQVLLLALSLITCQGVSATQRPPLVTIPLKKIASLSQYQFLFLKGFFNEAMQGYYFGDNIRALEELGVPEKDIHNLRLSSARSVLDNADELNEQLAALEQNDPRPFIVIAHSKGALELLALKTLNPDFFDQHVVKMFLIQGAFGGSPLADYFFGVGHPVDGSMPRLQATAFLALSNLQYFFKLFMKNGLWAMTSKEANYITQVVIQYYSVHRQQDQTKLVFVTASEKSGFYSTILELAGLYLATYYGPNDGLLLTADQCLENLGTCLNGFQADHWDLVMPYPISNQGYAFRRDFTYSLLNYLP